ncbi:MAG: hypothetical protein ACLFV7_12580 [Phycisphaerae bacterium]
MTWKRRSVALALVGLWGLLGAGCDTKPSPPEAPGGRKVKYIEVDASDSAEYRTVTEMEAARLNYHFRLRVLEEYYQRVGNLDKLRWARRELKNLKEAQTFGWKNIEVEPPSGESVAEADERLIVERAIQARQAWKDAVLDALEYYKKTDQEFHARMVRNIIARYDPIRTYMYFLDAEVPGPELRPTEVVSEADEIFQRALKLHKQGKGVLHTFLTTDYDKQREALLLFRELVRRYPTSTKIALAAYYIGDIYKEYFNEHVRAVQWYRRAWQWDPDVPEPARFQAATVYDYHLADPEMAVKLYRASMRDDPYRLLNYEHAQDRIIELTKKKEE